MTFRSALYLSQLRENPRGLSASYLSAAAGVTQSQVRKHIATLRNHLQGTGFSIITTGRGPHSRYVLTQDTEAVSNWVSESSQRLEAALDRLFQHSPDVNQKANIALALNDLQEV